MTTLTLYKGVDFDGVNSFPHITNKTAFDSYLSGKQQYTQDVHYNRIGEPILINKNYDTAMGYCYGCIDTGDKKYFIIPDTISVNENNRVYLTYSVDWFTSLEYDDSISFGRAHLIKSTSVDPLTYQQNIQPIDMRVKSDEIVEKKTITTGTDYYNQEIVILYSLPDEGGSIYTAFSPMVDNGAVQYGTSTRGLLPSDIYNGEFIPLLGTMPDNILGVFFLPIAITADLAPVYPTLEHETPWGYTIKAYTTPNARTMDTVNVNLATPITTTTTKIGVVTDTLGNIIYTVPYGRTVSTINFSMMTSLTQCLIRMDFQSVVSSEAQNAENSSVLYACEKIDYISDAYKNWAFGLKGVEIEERRMQKNKALVSGISGSAMTGAIGGASGNPWGAIAGVAGGIGGALMSYGVDTYYESQVNSLEDRKYQLAQDTMMPGSFVRPGFFHAIQLEASPGDIARYNAEISNFGADCNLPVASWTPSPGAYKFADVEVIADAPYGVKQNIKQKMMSGIKIVGVN